MPHFEGKTFTNNPNSPCIYAWACTKDRAGFAVLMPGAILYGITILLFFQSLRTLFFPPRGRVLWGLAAHAIAMFVCLTTSVTIELSELAPYYVNYREGDYELTFSWGIWGAWQYWQPHGLVTSNILSSLTFPLNQWLADGLLLYRCYVIYSGSYLVILPCLMYLATVVMGVMCLRCFVLYTPFCRDFNNLGPPYASTCIVLNVPLTLMIIARLALHSRSIRSALGTSGGVAGVYTTVVVILTKACTPYTAVFLIYLVFSANHAAGNLREGYGPSIIASIFVIRFQVIAPFLITVRIAARRAVTSNMTSVDAGSIRFKSQEISTSKSGTLADENPTGSMTHEDGEAPGMPNVGREVGIEKASL